MEKKPTYTPDSTAVRVALWRAMHVQIDARPHVLEDEIGIKLVAPDEGWRNRPDMHPQGTAPFRASIVARARFIEDVVAEQTSHGVNQYVILGAGLDTFAQRRPEVASQVSGTPFISFFSPEEMLALPQGIGFKKVEHQSTANMISRYFADRADGLKPSTGEEFLIATI